MDGCWRATAKLTPSIRNVRNGSRNGERGSRPWRTSDLEDELDPPFRPLALRQFDVMVDMARRERAAQSRRLRVFNLRRQREPARDRRLLGRCSLFAWASRLLTTKDRAALGRIVTDDRDLDVPFRHPLDRVGAVQLDHPGSGLL